MQREQIAQIGVSLRETQGAVHGCTEGNVLPHEECAMAKEPSQGLRRVTIPAETYAQLALIAQRQQDSVQSVLCAIIEMVEQMTEAGRIEIVFPQKEGQAIQITCRLPDA